MRKGHQGQREEYNEIRVSLLGCFYIHKERKMEMENVLYIENDGCSFIFFIFHVLLIIMTIVTIIM